MKTNITQDFVDEKGQKSELIITSNTDELIDLNRKYKLQRPESSNKYMQKGAKARSLLTSDIGVKSDGFAPILTLAIILSIGLLLVLYIFLRVN